MHNILYNNSPRFHQIVSNKRSKIKISRGSIPRTPLVCHMLCMQICTCPSLGKKLKETLLLCQYIILQNIPIALSYPGNYVAPPSYDEALLSSPTGSSDAPPPPPPPWVFKYWSCMKLSHTVIIILIHLTLYLCIDKRM